MVNRKLKFEGLPVGTYIRAYDFKPHKDIGERYIEGKIIDVDRDGLCCGFPVYKVLVTKDTLYPELPRTICLVPMENDIIEWDDRIKPLIGLPARYTRMINELIAQMLNNVTINEDVDVKLELLEWIEWFNDNSCSTMED